MPSTRIDIKKLVAFEARERVITFEGFANTLLTNIQMCNVLLSVLPKDKGKKSDDEMLIAELFEQLEREIKNFKNSLLNAKATPHLTHLDEIIHLYSTFLGRYDELISNYKD